MGKYAFAPAGTSKFTSKTLKRCIEYIGSTQYGSGSDYAKGKRYLKDKIGCTGNSIKLLFQTATKYVNHDFEKYGIYVFKYDKNKCAKILFEIISFVHLHSNDKKKTELFGHSVNLDTYISILYGEQLTSLEWVRDHNYKKQYEDAQNILNRIDEIRAELK